MARLVGLGVIVGVLIAGCGAGARPTTAAELADRLAGRGIVYTSTQPAPVPQGRHFRFDEGLVLVADDLWVELIRVEDERVFDIARGGIAVLSLAEASMGRAFPGKPEAYTRQPFLVIVRQEPEAGQVLAALNQILPAAE